MIKPRPGFLIIVFLLCTPPCALAQGTSQQNGIRGGYMLVPVRLALLRKARLTLPHRDHLREIRQERAKADLRALNLTARGQREATFPEMTEFHTARGQARS